MPSAETQFKPGKSGNPKGRPPKGATLSNLIDQKLDKDKFAEKVCRMAEGGNIVAIREVLDRIDGKVVEKQIIRQYTGIEALDNATDDELRELEEQLTRDLQRIRDNKEHKKKSERKK